MTTKVFYLFTFFLSFSLFVNAQPFINAQTTPKVNPYALLDLGFSGRLLHLNSDMVKTTLLEEKVKKSPRSLEEILAKSMKNEDEKEVTFVKTAKYHLIAGCFSKLNNANRLVSGLNEKGYNARIIGKNDQGLYMVSYQSYKTKKEALNAINSLSSKGISTWMKIQ